MAAMQLTDGNPNIADLSDQNRPDKLAEQFSELYDNQWTDCYQVLVDGLKKNEEESIHILLQIVQTSYNICLDRSQNVSTTARDILFAFAGRSDGEPDKALDALVQETLHKLKSYRTKNFKAAPTNIGKEIKIKLISTIGEPVVDACICYIEECIRICWLMCIKDPPMYIFCDKEAVFDKNKYKEYTEAGQNLSYIVWPVLYLHTNGPLMTKGVAQGRKGNTKVNAASPLLLELNHLHENHTGFEDTMKRDSDEQDILAIVTEQLPSKDNQGSTTALSVIGVRGNVIDSEIKQNAETQRQQTASISIHSTTEEPLLEDKVITTNSEDVKKECMEKDKEMINMGEIQMNVVIDCEEQ